ncbi:MAG TPA: hypothetical protein VKQ31_05275, partial [Steroidobacteraceae bacterium]|nr:hypothetical protein [Steroidobacteraceae bacterium]
MLRVLGWLGAAGLAVLLTALAVAYGTLRASLPKLDGTIRAAGLAAPVRITRDALGVATIEA